MKRIIIMGLLSFLMGVFSKAHSQNIELISLNEEQITQINNMSAQGEKFVEKYTDGNTTNIAQSIDKALIQWHNVSSEEKESSDHVISILGAYFGNSLEDQLSVEWKIFRDNKGEDFCVIHKEVFVYSFPFSAIYKAVIEKRENALIQVQSALQEQINEQ